MDEIRCVVFDIDDTLYLERDYVRSGFDRVGEWVRRNLGIEDFAVLAWRAFEAGARSTVFDQVLRQSGLDPAPEIVGKLVTLYRAHEPRIELCPDALVCLQGLSGRMALATVSDGPVESQRAKARALGLARWIDPMVFTAELGPDSGKPSRRAFEVVQEATGCAGAACVYVADNPIKDFGGPRSLGWRTVRVRRADSLHCASSSADSDVDVEVPDLRDSTALLRRLSTVR